MMKYLGFIAVVYLLAAFVGLEVNPLLWSEFVRTTVAGLYFAALIGWITKP